MELDRWVTQVRISMELDRCATQVRVNSGVQHMGQAGTDFNGARQMKRVNSGAQQMGTGVRCSLTKSHAGEGEIDPEYWHHIGFVSVTNTFFLSFPHKFQAQLLS